jgi:hypothetical protein
VSRAFWFAAGIASGVYGVFKVKRTAANFTPDGVGARVAALRYGARVFADEVSTAAHERETELLGQLRADAAGNRVLSAAAVAPRHLAPADRPAADDTDDTDDTDHSRESVTDGHR